MARYLAGSGPDLDTGAIAARMGIPQRIAARAHRAPLHDGDAGFEEARAWYESVYGVGAEHRREVLLKLDAAEVWYGVAKANLDRAPAPDRDAAAREFAAARKEYLRRFAEYKKLATEADARALGERIGVSLDKLQREPEDSD
jgi:hypothetical protein